MRSFILFIALLAANATNAFSQQAFPVTDSMPYSINGLKMGYQILSAREKEVGSKGDFSRYNVRFFVTNMSNEAKIIMYKQGLVIGDGAAPYLAQFNCTNATGARLTTKQAMIEAKACNVMAQVDDKDCNNKTTRNKRFVQIGFWIKGGETISTTGVVIVPLNQTPAMIVTPLYTSGLYGSALTGSNEQPVQTYTDPNYNNNNNNNQTYNNNQNNYNGPSFNPGNGFFHIHNNATNTFMNNQNGPVVSCPINNEWWSAQWQVIAIPNSNFFVIKNRWKNIFVNNDGTNGFTSNSQSDMNAMWMIQAVPGTNSYTLRNAATNAYLSMQNKYIVCYPNTTENDLTTRWTFESQ